MLLFTTDLDNTMIYSYKKIGDVKAVCVEWKEGKELSYMTEKAYGLLQAVAQKAMVVPVTTRSLEQYRRIKLFQNGVPSYAVAANGGILLVEGEIHTQWYEKSKELTSYSQKELEKAVALLKKDRAVNFEVRIVDDLFVFTKSSDITKSIADLKKCLDMEKVFLDSNGEKLYVFPTILNKGTALKRLKQYLNKTVSFAAGDSAFDIPMLLEADSAVIPDFPFLKEALKEKEKLYIAQKEGVFFAEELLQTIYDICK